MPICLMWFPHIVLFFSPAVLSWFSRAAWPSGSHIVIGCFPHEDFLLLYSSGLSSYSSCSPSHRLYHAVMPHCLRRDKRFSRAHASHASSLLLSYMMLSDFALPSLPWNSPMEREEPPWQPREVYSQVAKTCTMIYLYHERYRLMISKRRFL